MGKHFSQEDYQEIPFKNAVAEQLGTDPTTPANGRFWLNTAVNKIKTRLNGVTRILVDDGDSRLTDSRPPNGAASGDLAGTYPAPTIGANKVVLAKMGADILESGVVQGGVTGTAATSVAALRRLGFTANDALAGTTRLDQIAAPTTTVSMGNQRVLNVADPVSPQDAVSKNYADQIASGLDAKDSVKAATTANVVNLGAGAPNVVDGVTLTLADRVLVKNQSTPSLNGIYNVQVVGTGANGSWTRAIDMDSSAEVPGAFTFVEGGTVNANTGWVANPATPFTINTTAMPWAQFSGAGTYIAGDALTLTGTQFDVNVDNASLEIVADQLRVKSLGITNAMLAGGIDLTSKVTGALPIANGGTGQTTAAAARGALNTPGRYTALLPALTAGAWSANLTHGLNYATPIVSFQDGTTGERVDLDWKNIGTNDIQVRADIAVAASGIVMMVHA